MIFPCDFHDIQFLRNAFILPMYFQALFDVGMNLLRLPQFDRSYNELVLTIYNFQPFLCISIDRFANHESRIPFATAVHNAARHTLRAITQHCYILLRSYTAQVRLRCHINLDLRQVNNMGRHYARLLTTDLAHT